jgi:hypothetical protein
MHGLFPLIKRPARYLGLLSGAALVALFGAGQPADALTINPVFDASWATNPQAAQATAVVNSVIAEYQGDFSNPVTINVAFGFGELNGSPITSGAATAFATSDFLSPFGPATGFTLAQTEAIYAAAAAGSGATTVLQTADAHLPAAYPNPGCCGGTTPTNFFIPDAEYKALTGMALDTDPVDGFTGYATDFCGPGAPNCAYDYSGGPPPANTIDFKSVVEHELSHAMSRVDFAFSSGVAGGSPPFLTPQDFFKYDCGTGNLDPKFNITCFSYDGDATNPGGRTFANTSDSGDWINFATDSYNFGIDTGVFATVSTADIQLMCAEGWNDRAVCGTPAVTTPEPGTLALLGSSLLGFAALRRRRRR